MVNPTRLVGAMEVADILERGVRVVSPHRTTNRAGLEIAIVEVNGEVRGCEPSRCGGKPGMPLGWDATSSWVAALALHF